MTFSQKESAKNKWAEKDPLPKSFAGSTLHAAGQQRNEAINQSANRFGVAKHRWAKTFRLRNNIHHCRRGPHSHSHFSIPPPFIDTVNNSFKFFFRRYNFVNFTLKFKIFSFKFVFTNQNLIAYRPQKSVLNFLKYYSTRFKVNLKIS